MYDITDYGRMIAISRIIFGQYHIWDTLVRLGLKIGTPNEGINQRNPKIWTHVADKICCGQT